MDKYIDSYMHIGLPRFGNVAHAQESMRLENVLKSVLVLGPKNPDFANLFAAISADTARFRGIGIPFGDQERDRLQLAELQLRAGVMGIRMEPREVLDNPQLLSLVGQWGRWIYMTGSAPTEELSRQVLAWLDKYPNAHVAAPHFMSPDPDALERLRQGSVKELVRHPKFYPILTWHGGLGGPQQYGRRDLLPWVYHLAEFLGWSRMLWGTEYPVLFWRNETFRGARSWMTDLLPELSEEDKDAFYFGNAERLFFAPPAPPQEEVTLPVWVEQTFDKARVVSLFPTIPLDIPGHMFEAIWQEFADSPEYREGKPLHDFMLRLFTERWGAN